MKGIEADIDRLTALGFKQNAPGAKHLVGEVIEKTNSEKGDNFPDGTKAIVMGSQKVPEGFEAPIGSKEVTHVYLIQYPNMPLTFIVDFKIKSTDER